MEAAAPRRRVLIVDNSPDLAEALGMIVRMDEGLDFVGCAFTGKQALAQVAAGQVDVMVLDLRLDDCSGFDVLDRLRERGAPVKVIMHTGYAMQELREQARAKGAAGFVQKDGDFRALLKAIHSV